MTDGKAGRAENRAEQVRVGRGPSVLMGLMGGGVGVARWGVRGWRKVVRIGVCRRSRWLYYFGGSEDDWGNVETRRMCPVGTVAIVLVVMHVGEVGCDDGRNKPMVAV